MSDDDFDLLAGLIDDQEQEQQQTSANDVVLTQQASTNATRSTPGSAASKPGTSTSSTTTAGTTTALCTCPYSGYRLRYRISSADTVQISLRNVDIVSIPNLARRQRDTNAASNWAVFGVVSALELKTTAKAAKMFLSILLTDLNDHTFRLLAFDSAFDRLRSGTEIGHVLCVGNGKLLPIRGAGPGSADPAASQLVTISVDDPDQILQIGPCADFVICRGRRKDGRRCTIVVDQRKGGFCSYHVQAAYRSMSSGRMDLQHGSARNTMTGESAAKSGTLAGRTRPGMSPALAALMKPNTKRARLTAPDPERESKAKDVAIACLGRTASYRTPKVALVAGRPVYVKQTPVLIPVLSKSNPGISGTSLIDLDEDAPDPSVLRAVHQLAGRSLKAPDPNSAKQPKKLMDISAAINAGRTAPVKAAPPPRPPNAITADLRARLSDRKSINAHLVEQADRQEQETRFDMLETREQLADKMQSIASQQVQAHVCHDCKYTLEHQPTTCREMGHITTRVTVNKTWHKCKICSNRDVALGRHDPGRTCRRCGASDWIRTSMYQGKEVADRPKLQIMTNDRRRLRHD